MWCVVLCGATLLACGRVGFSEQPDSAPSYADVVLGDAPLGYWRLDDSDPIARDATGRFDGTYQGACTHVAGALANDAGTAAHFDGTTCAIDLLDQFAFTGTAAYAIEAWVALDSGGQPFQHVFTRQTRNQGPVDGYAVVIDDAGVYTERTIAKANVEAPHQPLDGTFHHVVASYDGATLRMFLDGTERSSMPDARPLPSYTVHAFIGASGQGGINNLRGALDEVAIYDRALAPDRIAAHHAAGL